MDTWITRHEQYGDMLYFTHLHFFFLHVEFFASVKCHQNLYPCYVCYLPGITLTPLPQLCYSQTLLEIDFRPPGTAAPLAASESRCSLLRETPHLISSGYQGKSFMLSPMSRGINQSLLINYHMLVLSEGASFGEKRGRRGRGQQSREETPRRKCWRDLTQEECKMWLN